LIVAVVTHAQAPATSEDRAVAIYGEEVITESELETLAGPSLLSLRQQIYQAKLARLETEIFQQLVKDAAAAEGVTEAEYRMKRIDQMVGEPDEGEVVKLMSQFRAQLAEDDLQAREQVKQALRQREMQRLSADLKDTLFAEAGVKILLSPPRVEVGITPGAPSRGASDAPIVMVEYTDYQCPFCNRVQPTIDALMERYEGKVLHVFKNLPLPNHPQAQLAGEASLCANDQTKFWEFHDWLFENQRTMNRDTMVAAAGELGIDGEAFTACIDAGVHRARVQADMKEARSFGITGTPGFLVNGRVISGAQPLSEFEAVFDEELERKGIEIPPKPTPKAAPSEEPATE
jgi:predicted DsbA family dithiol-disulfide isomerase